jgi:hypothetical protein
LKKSKKKNRGGGKRKQWKNFKIKEKRLKKIKKSNIGGGE